MSFYKFVSGMFAGLGTGTADLTRERQIPPLPAAGFYNRQNMVQGQLGCTNAPGFVKVNQNLVPSSAFGTTGAGLQGQWDLTPLAKRGG